MPSARGSNQGEAAPDAVEFDPSLAEAAFSALLPALRALPAGELAPVNTDLEVAAIAAVGVANRVKLGAVRASFERIPRDLFDPVHLENLDKAAWATWHAVRVWEKYRASATDARLPAPLVRHALEVEARMQACSEYYFADDPELGAEIARLKGGSGYRDLAGDLLGYAEVYRARHATVSADRKHYRPTDYADAVRIAQQIFALLGEALGADGRRAGDDLARAWTFLLRTYAEVSETGMWLERSDPDRRERYPSLVSAGRSPRRKKDDEPAPPA